MSSLSESPSGLLARVRLSPSQTRFSLSRKRSLRLRRLFVFPPPLFLVFPSVACRRTLAFSRLTPDVGTLVVQVGTPSAKLQKVVEEHQDEFSRCDTVIVGIHVRLGAAFGMKKEINSDLDAAVQEKQKARTSMDELQYARFPAPTLPACNHCLLCRVELQN